MVCEEDGEQTGSNGKRFPLYMPSKKPRNYGLCVVCVCVCPDKTIVNFCFYLYCSHICRKYMLLSNYRGLAILSINVYQ